MIVAASTWLSIDLTRAQGGVASVWITNGLMVGLMLFRPLQQWSAILIAGLIGNLVARLGHHDPFPLALGLSLANLLEVVLVAGPIRRRVPDITDQRQLMVLSRTATVSTLIACAISGVIAASILSSGNGEPFVTDWMTWFTAHVLGMVVVATLVVVAVLERRNLLGRPGHRLDFVLCLLLVLAVSTLVFAQNRYPLLFLVSLPLLFATVRHQFAGFVLGVAVISLVAGFGTAMGRGPFGLIASASPLERTMLLQLFIGASCLLALPVAIALAERDRLEKRVSKSEARYRMLADHTRDLIVRLRADGTVLYISQSVKQILGREPEEMREPHWDLVHPQDRKSLTDALSQLVTTGGIATVIYRLQHKAGHYVWIEALVERVEDSDPSAPAEIISAGRDVSKRIAAETALAESRAKLRAITDNMPALIGYVDAQERYTYANAHYERLFGTDAAGIVGRTVREARGEAAYQSLAPHVAAALRGEPQTFERGPDTSTGNRYLQSHCIPDSGPDGAILGFYALTFDITPLKLAERELELLARVDALTGLANRRMFNERLSQAMLRARRHHAPIALMLLDVDHFKRINDSLGHLAGDVVLQVFADRLQRCVYDVDLAARLGGDEFVVLIEDAVSAEVAELVAKKILAALCDPIIVDDSSLLVSASIGIAFCREVATAKNLLALADKALYASKSAGRNTYTIIEE